MKAGAYFSKPKLLSEKIQSLLDRLIAVESFSSVDSGGIPQSLFAPNPQHYQEYYHLACANNKYSETFYEPSPNTDTTHTNTRSNIPKQPQKKKKKQQKSNNQPQKQPKGQQDGDIPAIGRCTFVVGQILEISDHPNADAMLVEMIDVGEDKPRQICSGIKGKVSKAELKGSLVMVFNNLKAAKLRGTVSNGMILCASNEDKSKLEVIRPPKGSKIGERVVLEDEDLSKYNPTNTIKIKKKNNPWSVIRDDLRTDDACIACYQGRKFVTSKGPLMVTSLTNARIS